MKQQPKLREEIKLKKQVVFDEVLRDVTTMINEKIETITRVKIANYCDVCGEKLNKHPKCKDCGILLHDEDERYKCRCGKQHGILYKNNLCLTCHEQNNLPK